MVSKTISRGFESLHPCCGSSARTCLGGGIGRRAGFRCRFLYGSVGSSPTRGIHHNKNSNLIASCTGVWAEGAPIRVPPETFTTTKTATSSSELYRRNTRHKQTQRDERRLCWVGSKPASREFESLHPCCASVAEMAIRAGLRIQFPSGIVGSSPTRGTLTRT